VGYALKVIDEGTSKDALLREVTDAIASRGRWERFSELRMAAGPTVRIEPLVGVEDGYRASVTWGSQEAAANVRGLSGAIETADRLAYTFYEIRNEGPKQID
jgi:hypothetical protein